MEPISAFASPLWRLVSWMPGFFFRRFFSQHWLATHTAVDLRPRHEPVSIRAGELPELHVWLVITNRGHFSIELDRLAIELTFGAAIMRSSYLQRTSINANGSTEVFVRSTISSAQVAHIAKNLERPHISLQVQAEFNCKVHNFSINTEQLSGIKPEILSF
jgi:LEA14-like dessication related protein